MKVLAIGASNSQNSINKLLATYTAKLIPNAIVDVLDLNDYEMPIYSEDREKQHGIPDFATQFFDKIAQADVVVISFAEHNGSYTAAFKNIFDWASRINMKVYQGKPIIMLSTSPGEGGAASVLSSAVNSAPYFDADVIGSLSIPSFYQNFDKEAQTLINSQLVEKVNALISKISEHIIPIK